MIRKFATMMAVVILTAAAAQADMTYSPFLFSNALGASGDPIVNGTYVMVLDLNGDGWQGNNYASQSSGLANGSSWLWDPNDMLMDRGQIDNGDAFPFRSVATADIPATYTPNVDHYYLLWFDTPYNAAASGPGTGVHYGVEDLGTVGGDPGDYGPFAVGGVASLTTVAGAPNAWHNGALSADVNDDGVVTSADAMLIIDKLNAEGPHLLIPGSDALPGGGGSYWDVTNDASAFISPLDALRVINQINDVGSLGAQSVPEPASLLLLTAGAIWIGRRRNRVNSPKQNRL